jgi:tetratricopeptide (TPR) repeat protein
VAKPDKRPVILFRTDSILFHLFIILLLGMAAYANSFSVPLQYDDVMTLRKFVSVPLGPAHIGGMRWITDLTFWLNRTLHGESVAGYHAVNLAIHLTSAVCLYHLVLSSIRALQSSFSLVADEDNLLFLWRFVPFTTAAIFVCHPVQTQAVTYIAQRYTSLAAMLYLASLLAYLRARIPGAGTRAWLWGTTAFFLALLAMMSKEIAFTLPLMAVIMEIFLFRGALLKRPLFLILGSTLMLVIPLRQLQKYELQGFSDVLSALRQASVEVQGISRGDYFLTQVRVVVTYLRLLLFPVNQNLDYEYPLQHSLFTPQILASLSLHLALATVALLLFLRSRSALQSGYFGAGAAMRLASLGIVWFYTALAVESSIIPIRDVICEHRLYLPSAGFILAVTCLAALTADRTAGQKAAWWVAAVCCLTLATATVVRNRVWSTPLSLWSDVLKKSPNKARAYFHVGYSLAQGMMPDKALPYLVRSIELNPAAIDFRVTLNGVIDALGTFRGRYDTGMKYHLMVYTIDPRDERLWRAVSCNNLGLAYEYLGNYAAARAQFEKAASLNPDLDLAWLNLAVISSRLHDPAGVSAALERLGSINPGLAGSATGLLTIAP